MKALIFAASPALNTGVALTQGQFTFVNRNLCGLCLACGLDAPVTDMAGIRLSGPAYLAQAYVGLALDSLAPVGVIVPFRTAAAAGYITILPVTTPFPAFTAVVVEMRAWEAVAGNSYEEAMAAGGQHGRSNPVHLVLTEPPAAPPRCRRVPGVPRCSGCTLVLPALTRLADGAS
jgi:hypothetical protein